MVCVGGVVCVGGESTRIQSSSPLVVPWLLDEGEEMRKLSGPAAAAASGLVRGLEGGGGVGWAAASAAPSSRIRFNAAPRQLSQR